jgi:hypothetical protein
LLGVEILVGLLGSILWADWVVPLYTLCVLRNALRFLIKILLLIKKKVSHLVFPNHLN